ncbi:hypothetical protein FA15DRAFT_667946 [Coprinopsis marcescibilis]|uniref:Transmembrane protein n=1 Tax=Coprinopsis marcescibilis TaxID=230819 RepID=A0A5C3LCB3_COPMA|nr:hypothetical protein FA15DRAFT_667946 [Coprinopsis marcescibilis]
MRLLSLIILSTLASAQVVFCSQTFGAPIQKSLAITVVPERVDSESTQADVTRTQETELPPEPLQSKWIPCGGAHKLIDLEEMRRLEEEGERLSDEYADWMAAGQPELYTEVPWIPGWVMKLLDRLYELQEGIRHALIDAKHYSPQPTWALVATIIAIAVTFQLCFSQRARVSL